MKNKLSKKELDNLEDLAKLTPAWDPLVIYPETVLKLIKMARLAPKPVQTKRCPSCKGTGEGGTITVPEQSWDDTRTVNCYNCGGSGRVPK